MFFEIPSYLWVLYQSLILLAISLLSRSNLIKLFITKVIYRPHFASILLPIGLINLLFLVSNELYIITSIQILPEVINNYLLEQTWFLLFNYGIMFLFMIEVSQDFFRDKSEAARLAMAGVLIYKIIEFFATFIGGVANDPSEFSIIFVVTVLIKLCIIIIATIISLKYIDLKRGIGKSTSESFLYLFIILSEVMITKVLIVLYLLKHSMKLVAPNLFAKIDYGYYSFISEKYKDMFASILVSNLIPILYFYIYGSNAIGDSNYELTISFIYSIPILLLFLLPKLNIVNWFTLIFAYVISLFGFYGIFFLSVELTKLGLRLGDMAIGEMNSYASIIVTLPLWIFINIIVNMILHYKRLGYIGDTYQSRKLAKTINLGISILMPMMLMSILFKGFKELWYFTSIKIQAILIVTVLPIILYKIFSKINK